MPFDLLWPMVREDITTAVREICGPAHRAGGASVPEVEVSKGVADSGVGPIARLLTKDE